MNILSGQKKETTLMDILWKSKEETKVVLPLDPEVAKLIVEGLDGTADKILIQLPTGKCGVWQKMAKPNDKPMTRIGEYDVPGEYNFVGYTSEYQPV